MLATLVIVFREVIEAGLIVGIVLAATKGVARRGFWVSLGIGAGALGGFFLPKAFGWLGRATGFPQAAFLALLVLTLVSLTWLVLAVRTQRALDAASEPAIVPSPGMGAA